MKVTEISPQKNNKHRISVFVDGKYAFSLDETDAVRLKIKVGRELTERDIENCIMESGYSKARELAFDILSRKPVTKKELGEKLTQKGYDEAIVCEVTEELSELGYLDDEEYARLYLESCRAKLWGDKKIRYEMHQKGISDDIVSMVIEENCDEDETDEIVRTIIAKYASSDLTDIKTKAKVTRYLASRGFDFSLINTCIHKAIEEVLQNE